METSSEFASGRDPGWPHGPASAPAPLPLRGRFGRECRLTRESDFREAFDAGESVPARTLVLWVRRQPDAARRLGVVASKRTFHFAAERNRAKRLLRESFRLHRHLLAEGVDLVLLARRRILDGGRAEVDRDLLKALRKTGLLKDGAAAATAAGADLRVARPTADSPREAEHGQTGSAP